MQQVIYFFIRSKNFLLFLLLFTVSVYLTIQAHSFHSTKYINSTNFVAGGLHQLQSSITNYFSLRKQNTLLETENAYLRGLINYEGSNQSSPDSLQWLNFKYTPAKIISNSYSKSHNILTINKGTEDGIRIDMGVISTNGIVGIVEKVSKNYATVQSVLNIKSQTNAKLKKTNHFGILVWEKTNDPFHAQLIDIPRHTEFSVGDTIVTGGRSTIFPEGIPIGVIDEYRLEEINNVFEIRVKLFSDMTSLHSVYLIENYDYYEITELENQ